MYACIKCWIIFVQSTWPIQLSARVPRTDFNTNKIFTCNSETFKVDPIILLTWHHVFKKVGNTTHQALVVQRLDSTIHSINLYPVDSAVSFPNTYPLDSGLSGG